MFVNTGVVTLKFSRTQQHVIKKIYDKFGVTNSIQSRDTDKNSERVIFDFGIFCQSFINENFHNQTTSRDIDMKLGPVIKLNNKSTVKPKQTDDDVMQANFNPLFSFKTKDNLQPFENLYPDAWSIKLTFSIIVTFRFTKTGNRT